MPLADELLVPIAGENPSGIDLRYDPVYDAIREARRQDDDLNQGAWQRERKVADFVLVAKLCVDSLKNKSKDLQLAAWLAEALLNRDNFAGFAQGLAICRGLIDNFWDTLYPPLDDGDPEPRATPLQWIASKLDVPLLSRPITGDGYNLLQYKISRTVGYEDQAKDNNQKKAREKQLAEGKLAPELFDKSVASTPKSFYAETEKALGETLTQIAQLTGTCDARFAEAPSFGRLKSAAEEVLHLVHALLQKKRETDPDPVQAEPAQAVAEAAATETASTVGPESTSTPAASPLAFHLPPSSEPPDRALLVASIASAAASLRKREPYSPAPFLLMRGLRWGDLRVAAAASDPTMLEAPSSELRQQIKRLALQEKWKELLDAAEAVMALPCGRAWLDLQRFVVEACVALGKEYDLIAIAIRSELRALVRDVPQLLTATLMDDTPTANSETRKWILELCAEPGRPESSKNGAGPTDSTDLDSEEILSFRWQRKFVDSFSLAKEALRSGQESRAFEIMQAEIARQRSARGRFQRKLQFVELCVSAGKEAIAQPILDDLIAAIDTHKLEEWEDRGAIAQSLATIARASKKISGDAKEKQKFFERICRLDPVQALNF